MNLFPYVEGRTRLQKFGMLSFYEVLKDEAFFDDWVPNNCGGFSSRLANSLERLEECGYIRSDKIIVGHDYPIYMYSVTEKGKHVLKKFKINSQKLEKIKTILSHYFPLSLNALLTDVCVKYPWLVSNSKIIADSNKTLEIDSYLEFESEDQFQEKMAENANVPTSTNPNVFGDDYFREKLVRFIGLEKVPDLDYESFNRIKGILSEHIDAENFDAEKAVREVRGC